MKVYLEIKKGIGGSESSIFVKDILYMYESYFKRKRIRYKLVSKCTDENGIKNIILLLNKIDWKIIKNENGIHRIQRIPSTDGKGRIHTSTCNVKVTKITKKINIEIKKKDLKYSVFKSSGAGGQHVNKTNSAVRIKHIPSGITVECQNQRSQQQNKKEAESVLISRIENKNILKKERYYSEKIIRIYFVEKNIVKDKRINKNFSIDMIKNGYIYDSVLLLKKNEIYRKNNRN
ncbi:peptide chain release factor-like protein [Candidatus Vidania fulgoroideorum]